MATTLPVDMFLCKKCANVRNDDICFGCDAKNCTNCSKYSNKPEPYYIRSKHRCCKCGKCNFNNCSVCKNSLNSSYNKCDIYGFDSYTQQCKYHDTIYNLIRETINYENTLRDDVGEQNNIPTHTNNDDVQIDESTENEIINIKKLIDTLKINGSDEIKDELTKSNYVRNKYYDACEFGRIINYKYSIGDSYDNALKKISQLCTDKYNKEIKLIEQYFGISIKKHRFNPKYDSLQYSEINNIINDYLNSNNQQKLIHIHFSNHYDKRTKITYSFSTYFVPLEKVIEIRNKVWNSILFNKFFNKICHTIKMNPIKQHDKKVIDILNKTIDNFKIYVYETYYFEPVIPYEIRQLHPKIQKAYIIKQYYESYIKDGIPTVCNQKLEYITCEFILSKYKFNMMIPRRSFSNKKIETTYV